MGTEERLLELPEGEGDREGEDEDERAGWTSIASRSDSILAPRYSWGFCFMVAMESLVGLGSGTGTFWKWLS